MTAYSFQEWNSLSSDEQARIPGVSIARDHPINNRDRGVYWSGSSSASALAVHIRETLTGPDRINADRVWNTLKQMHRTAVETPQNVDRAMGVRHRDADRALENSNFNLDDVQLEQMQSVTDDVYGSMDVAERAGVEQRRVVSALMYRAAGIAVTTTDEESRDEAVSNYVRNMRGYAGADNAAVDMAYADTDGTLASDLGRFFNEPEGERTFSNLAQGVQQLYSLIRTGELDALDQASSLGDRDFGRSEGEERDEAGQDGEDLTLTDRRVGREATDAENIEFVRDILRSIPLERNPQSIAQARNFSVRMDTVEEAKFVETMLHWTAQHDALPAPEQVNNAFAAWRDTGVIANPYNEENISRVGLVVGQSATANDMAEGILKSMNGKEVQFMILTANSDRYQDGSEIDGRPVINVIPAATPDGVVLEGAANAPRNAILVINLQDEQAKDPIQRSLAANAFVGSSSTVGYLGGSILLPHEAQAIHIAGTARKLTIGMDASGNQMTNSDLKELRSAAQQVDRQADPNRYFTAGHGRPFEGVYGVVFDGARNFDAANKKHAPGRDIMGEAFARLPKHSTIMTIDNPKHAAYRWLGDNAKDRQVLYAEAERKLSFATDYTTHSDREAKIAREAETVMRIYDRPREAREYGPDQLGRMVCQTEEIAWTDPRVRGAILLVSGNTHAQVMNGAAQATKVAQETIMDRAHTGMIFDDMQSDYHAAHLTRLAVEMGKSVTIFDKEGHSVSMSQARESTKRNAQSLSEVNTLEVKDRMRGNLNGLGSSEDLARAERRNMAYALHEPVGQLALMSLPNMDAQKAKGLAGLGFTLEEIYTDRSGEMQQQLFKAGMPSETVKMLHDSKVWERALETALMSDAGAKRMPATEFKSAGESPLLPEGRAGFVYGNTDGSKIVAMIGNNAPSYDGATAKIERVEELVDREQIRNTIGILTKQGHTIATTLEEGVGRVVLEEALKVEGAKMVVVTSGNPMAAAPELRMLAGKLDEENRLTMIMPANIAPYYRKIGDGTMMADRYVDDRHAMHENLAHVADVAIVVQASSKDQSMHMVNMLNSKDKPVAVMVPTDREAFASDAYSANVRLLRGAGQASIESIGLAGAVQARGYANITDKDTDVVTHDGVTRGNAGTFESVKTVRNDMARSGHHYKEVSWGTAARAVGTEKSTERFGEDLAAGKLEPLGPYKEKTARELEKISLARWNVSEETRETFRSMQRQHDNVVRNEAAYGDMSLSR